MCRPVVSSARWIFLRFIDFRSERGFNRGMHLGASFACLLMLMLLGCRDPNAHQSSANESRVADRQVVLVRNGKEVGAFLLRNQRFGPGVTDYSWFLRSDGSGQF